MMNTTPNVASTLDGTVVRFEVREGIRRISCAVLGEALEAASGLTAPSTVALRRGSFDRFRTLIDAAAKLKSRTLPSEFIGPIVLTGDDLRSMPPQTGVPPFGSSARGRTWPASAIDGVLTSSATMSGDAASLGPVSQRSLPPPRRRP